MVVYFHTRAFIYAVANGYCSDVKDRYHGKVTTNLVGCRLVGGTQADTRGEPIETDAIVAGHRLKFEIGSAAFISDVIEFVEKVGSMSVLPTKMPSLPPESDSFRDPIPTVPEIILPKPPGLPKP
ncbi:MAG: hypothetical protein RDU25_01490 [Patescibacteria group bacterium]|nr:hypothetical protein [Patescibacteria group bacterium]